MKIILGPVDLVVGKSSKVREKIPPSITCLGREAKIQTSLDKIALQLLFYLGLFSFQIYHFYQYLLFSL